MSKADERQGVTVEEYLASISDELVQKDAQVLADIMQRMDPLERAEAVDVELS